MNGLISYLPESEVAVARLNLFSPTTGGLPPPAPQLSDDFRESPMTFAFKRPRILEQVYNWKFFIWSWNKNNWNNFF